LSTPITSKISLTRHTGLYALARGGPALISFLSVFTYTRLLSTDQYGLYALTLSSASLFSTILFNWLRVSLVRFLPAFEGHQRGRFMSTIYGAFLLCFAAGLTLAGAGYLLSPSVPLPIFLGGLAFFASHSWVELNLELERANVSPRRYGVLSASRALLSLIFGGLFAFLGLGALGLLVGISSGNVLASLIFTRPDASRLANGIRIDPTIARRIFSFGAPLTLTFALRFIVTSSDRFMLAAMIGVGASGVYAAGHDFADHTLGVITMIIHLAAYPLIIRAMESGGVEQASDSYRNNITLLLLVTTPATIGICILAGPVSYLMFGSDFAASAATVIPLVAVGTYIAGLKAFGFDIIFHLTEKTGLQVIVVAIAAAANILANLILIPEWGIVGAAGGSALAYAASLVASVLISRPLLRFPFPWNDFIKILLAASTMGLLLSLTLELRSPLSLLLQIPLGVLLYGLLCLALNISNLRVRGVQYFARLIGTRQ